MAEVADLYERLGIEPDANVTQIRKAYLLQALSCHPDKNPDDDSGEKFKKLARAYEILLDPAERKKYDNSGLKNVRKSTESANDVFQVVVNGISKEEVQVNIRIVELLDRWSDPKTKGLSIKKRFGLREDQPVVDLINEFLDNGRLLHVHTVGKDNRQPIAFKGTSDSSVTIRSHADFASSST